jgi:hypothetical protein
MRDPFDSPEILVEDDGIAVPTGSKAKGALSNLFMTILLPPNLPADLSITPEEQWQQFCMGAGQEWWQAWQQLSNRDLADYIKLLIALPDVFQNTHSLIDGYKGTLPYQRLKFRYQGTSTWMYCLINADRTPRPEWNDYKPYGLQAKALLDLCIAVYEYKSHDCIFHGARGLFTSPYHLWFWCLVAKCMRSLQDQGLTAPLLSTQLQSKQSLLIDDQADTEWIKQRKAASFNTFCTGWQDFLEHLDIYLIGEAMKGNYIENTELDALDVLVQVHESTRNTFRRSKKYQASFLYRFLKESTIRTFTTEQNIKLPKPKRKRKT